VIDQLEELLTLDSFESAELDCFVAAVAALSRSGLAWVVATMRSDFYDRLEQVPALVRLAADDACYRLLPPDDAELGEIIRQPAREAGLIFEFDPRRGVTLDEVIPQSAAKGRHALPLLSFLLGPKNTGAWSNSKGKRPRNGARCQRISTPPVLAPAPFK